MNDFVNITCPCCSTILVVERRTGKVVEERRPLIENSTGDRYEDALKKVKGRAAEAEEKFKKFQQDQSHKKQRLESLFKDALERAKENDDEPPPNPFDRD